MWDEKRARKLAYMLECAVQRRFPRGIRILMQVGSHCCTKYFVIVYTTGYPQNYCMKVHIDCTLKSYFNGCFVWDLWDLT